MTSNQWTEFVHITAHYFQAGEQPWTEDEWHMHSVPDENDPEYQRQLNLIGPLDSQPFPPQKAPDDPTWWDQGYLWWVPELGLGHGINYHVDAETDRLTTDVLRFEFRPLDTGAWRPEDLRSRSAGLIASEIQYNCLAETFNDDALNCIKELTDSLRRAPSPGSTPEGIPATRVSVLTVWQCNANRDYWSGEESPDWWLLGHVAPGPTGVVWVPFKQDTPFTLAQAGKA